MIKLLRKLLLFVIFFSCKQRNSNHNLDNIRSDIRFGSRFFSIHVNRNGEAFVVKGTGSYYTGPFKIESADTSDMFKLDSSAVFFKNLSRIKDHPVIDSNKSDAPRVEIYYNQNKIYDAYKWDEKFWDLFRPIMQQIPKGFNPFRADDKPFG